MNHASDCAKHNAPAMQAGPCDCQEVPPLFVTDGHGGMRPYEPGPDWVTLVRQWHESFGVPVHETPTFVEQRIDLRTDLVLEEAQELVLACYECSPAKVLQESADLIYVIIGALHEFGLAQHLDAAFREVARANMSKLGADGKPIYREDGKVLKGPNFKPADIAAVLEGRLP